ncbi:hypothetical protein CAPTEDRAFT_207302 [Capitella teleta]|uniref:Cilia- and flagella-associated protein 418 n=1 Tax=Capitella teleta TaxID=283909 RepID=R7V674_CAPTE|nr:hypothetical protein CAPTEDRAFT_207302 [Capitella teleta]|eukprot:ELU14363.1 hypothetical protein CAPTEDRAFT_207302 [Capitella teleta]
MDDEFDDLLNEVEDKFCASRLQKPTHKHQAVTQTNHGGKKKETPRLKTNKSELDDTIDDLLQDTPLDHTASSPRVPIAKEVDSASGLFRQSSEKQATKKCFPVFIGGTETPLGLSTTVNSRACNGLRCTDCDFKISTFDGFKWHASVDYLFLRNNMPDFHRLNPKLIKKKGCRAYACQCKWKSVEGDLTNLQSEIDLKWVCGKH